MATNRFDKPIESEYISQYTPIPFEQLYAIGKANNERVDKAYCIYLYSELFFIISLLSGQSLDHHQLQIPRDGMI